MINYVIGAPTSGKSTLVESKRSEGHFAFTQQYVHRSILVEDPELVDAWYLNQCTTAKLLGEQFEPYLTNKEYWTDCVRGVGVFTRKAIREGIQDPEGDAHIFLNHFIQEYIDNNDYHVNLRLVEIDDETLESRIAQRYSHSPIELMVQRLKIAKDINKVMREIKIIMDN